MEDEQSALSFLGWNVETCLVIDDLPHGLVGASHLLGHRDGLVLHDARGLGLRAGRFGRLWVGLRLGALSGGVLRLALLRRLGRCQRLLLRRLILRVASVLEVERSSFGDGDTPVPAPLVEIHEAAVAERNGARLERVAGRIVEISAGSDPAKHEELSFVQR